MLNSLFVSAELLLAVFAASILGSLHCVGMCGPFALMATGSTSGRARLSVRLAAYHFGRLTTYLIAGSLAGAAGYLLSASGESIGIQSAAARVAGIFMIVLGLVKLVAYFRSRRARVLMPSSSKGRFSMRISAAIAKTRPVINRLPGSSRAFAAGALTTLLPCGWLYMFLLVAAGTGHGLSAMIVMTAFWLGSLPALTALVFGAMQLAPRLRSTLPLAGAILLLVSGVYTTTGRAAVDMRSLTSKASSVHNAMMHDVSKDNGSESQTVAAETLRVLKREPLPCCVAD